MIATDRELARVRNPVLCLSALAWLLLIAPLGGTAGPAHHPAPAHRHHGHAAGEAAGEAGAPAAVPAASSPRGLAAGWLLMLVAMMAPVLIPHLVQIRLRSFADRRARALALFVAGYGGVWMAAGAVLVGIQLALGRLLPGSSLAAAGALLAALIWQCSPIKQRSLNRCHAEADLAAFGAAADLGALRFGAFHAGWCVLSCWALMLFPLLLPQGHLAAMALVTVVIFGERIERPMPPSWRWRGLGRLQRLVAAQARIRLQRLGWAAATPKRRPIGV